MINRFNPFKLNGIAKPYQLDKSISVSWVVEWYFYFYLNFKSTFYKQSVETLIRHSVASGLGLHCLLVPQKGR